MPSGSDLRDRLCRHGDVSSLQRRQEVRAEKDALAAERVVGPDPLPQLWVAQLRTHEERRAKRGDAADRPRVADRHREQLGEIEDVEAAQLLDEGERLHGGAQHRRIRAVAPRHEPVAGALEDLELRDLRGDLGHDLHCARARTNDGNAPSAQVVVVVPFGGVKASPGERLATRDSRQRRFVKLARREDHGVGLDALAVQNLHRPGPAPLVPCAAGDRRVGPDQAVDAVAARDVTQVVEDLSLQRADAGSSCAVARTRTSRGGSGCRTRSRGTS